MPIIAPALILLVIIIYIARYVRPFGNTMSGETFLVRPLSLIARMRMHIVPAIIGTIVAVLLVRYGDAPLPTIAIPLVAYLILVALPTSYILTTEGVRLGSGTFRRWTEFAGAIRYRGGAMLQGANNRRGMRIWLGGDRGDDEFLLVLRHAIKDAYKGSEHPQVVAFASENSGADGHSALNLPV
ncbi:MAG: hypothetical protein QM589_08820 [Thermomicrobiales bacterium]